MDADFEKQSGVIATNPSSASPTYTAILHRDGRYKNLVLTPTQYGSAIHCNFEIVATQFAGDEWRDLPEESESFLGSSRQRIDFGGRTMAGSYLRFEGLDRVVRTGGTFVINQVIPKVGGVKALAPDTKVADGRSVDTRVSSLSTVTANKKFSTLHLIQFPLERNCFGAMTSIPQMKGAKGKK